MPTLNITVKGTVLYTTQVPHIAGNDSLNVPIDAYLGLSEFKQAEQEPVSSVKCCPFCGSCGVSTVEGSTYRWRVAMCNNCGAQAGEIRFDTLNKNLEAAEQQANRDAIEEWNKRAAPVRTKNLTDDEIDYLIDEACQTQMPYDMFARAVIAKFKEKNK